MISLSRHECNLGLSIAGVIWRTYGGKKTTVILAPLTLCISSLSPAERMHSSILEGCESSTTITAPGVFGFLEDDAVAFFTPAVSKRQQLLTDQLI